MSINVDKDLAKILWNTSHAMIKDDKGDLGWITYRNRRLHHYQGHVAPHHPEPLHHYMFGTALCFLAQFAALISAAQEANLVYQDIQSALLSEEEFESVSAVVQSADSDLRPITQDF